MMEVRLGAGGIEEAGEARQSETAKECQEVTRSPCGAV